MKIYTRTGDTGKTGLFGGPRVHKDDFRIEAYGAVDELNSQLGLARTKAAQSQLDSKLEHIQNDLFSVGAELASPNGAAGGLRNINADDVTRLESWIDELESDLPPLKTFILPGGGDLAAQLHVCRTTCRRAERRTWTLDKNEVAEISPSLTQYLNRLSDLLFVMARTANRDSGVSDVPWTAPEPESP